MPSGTPTREPTRPEMPTMISVSTNDLMNRSISCDDMVQLLYRYAFCLHECFCLCDLLVASLGQNRQRTEGLLLNFIDLAMQNVEVQAKAANYFREQGFFYPRAGKGQAQQMRLRFTFLGLRQFGAHALQNALGQVMRDDITDHGACDRMLWCPEYIEHGAVLYDFPG